MNKRINFEDNIYILNVRIRMIRDTLTLETDPGLFLDKTIDDLDFIDSALETLLASLIDQIRLIARDEEFGKLADLEWEFKRLLTEMCQGRNSLSVSRFPSIRGKLLILREKNETREKVINKTRVLEAEALPLVSSDEMSELLKGF
jgi:hypothetical protein